MWSIAAQEKCCALHTLSHIGTRALSPQSTGSVQMSRLTASQNKAQLIYHPRALTTLNCFLVAVFLSKVTEIQHHHPGDKVHLEGVCWMRTVQRPFFPDAWLRLVSVTFIGSGILNEHYLPLRIGQPKSVWLRLNVLRLVFSSWLSWPSS